MTHVHVMGCASALFDNLLSWRNRITTFEQSTLECLPITLERIRAARPEWVVYCGPTAASRWDEPGENSSDEAVQMSRIAQTVAEIGTRLLLISSDRVFAGPRMFHDESEPPADDAYAQYLHSIEQAALTFAAIKDRVLVVRTNTFGWSHGGESFAERVWRALDERQSVELSTTAYATPILASDLADLLLRCLRVRLSGVVHIGGAERTSPFRFGQELAMAAGFDPRLVKPQSAGSVEEPLILSAETSLGSRRVRRELDVSLPLLRESVARFADQAANGYRDQLRAASDGALARAA